jgi:phosphatidate cytidylyltransferase
LSALVLAPIVIAAVWLGGWAWTSLVAVAAVLMASEWDRLTRGQGSGAPGVLYAAIAVLAVGLAGAGQFAAALLALAAGIAVVAAVAAAAGRRPYWLTLGIVYVGLPTIAMVWLRGAPVAGRETVLWLLALVWATDAGAYLVGRTVGGARLAPRVSPGKTWSGLAGGVACGALAGGLAALLTKSPGFAMLAALSAVLAVVSQLGDLAESWVKRHFGVKDTGTLIPGHGGILDRVDGLLLAAPAVAALSLFGGESPLLWR